MQKAADESRLVVALREKIRLPHAVAGERVREAILCGSMQRLYTGHVGPSTARGFSVVDQCNDWQRLHTGHVGPSTAWRFSVAGLALNRRGTSLPVASSVLLCCPSCGATCFSFWGFV